MCLITEKEKEVDSFLSDCDTGRAMQDLIGSYIMLEEFFMREMVLKVMEIFTDGSYFVSIICLPLVFLFLLIYIFVFFKLTFIVMLVFVQTVHWSKYDNL